MVLRLKVGLIAALLAIAGLGRSQEAAAAQFDLLQAPAAAAQEAVRRAAASHPEADATRDLERILEASFSDRGERAKWEALAGVLRRPEAHSTLKMVLLDPGPPGGGDPGVLALFTHGQNLFAYRFGFPQRRNGEVVPGSAQVMHLTYERRNIGNDRRGSPRTKDRAGHRKDGNHMDGNNIARLWSTGVTAGFAAPENPAAIIHPLGSPALEEALRNAGMGRTQTVRSIAPPSAGAVAIPRLHDLKGVPKALNRERGSGWSGLSRRPQRAR